MLPKVLQMKKETISFRVPTQMKENWNKLAEKKGITLSNFLISRITATDSPGPRIPDNVRKAYMNVYMNPKVEGDQIEKMSNSVLAKCSFPLLKEDSPNEIFLDRDDCKHILEFANSVFSHLVKEWKR